MGVGNGYPRQHRLSKISVQRLGYPPENISKTLLPKTPHTCVTGRGEIRQVPIWKLYSYWLPSIMLEESMHDTEGEDSILVLPDCEPCKIQ